MRSSRCTNRTARKKRTQRQQLHCIGTHQHIAHSTKCHSHICAVCAIWPQISYCSYYHLLFRTMKCTVHIATASSRRTSRNSQPGSHQSYPTPPTQAACPRAAAG
jgi:hypothetical protein